MPNNKISIDSLNIIEIVDKLDNYSSARVEEHKIFLARTYGLNDITHKSNIETHINSDHKLKRQISTIYHELWHISTWKKHQELYNSFFNPKNIYAYYACHYWIEYIAHIETVFMEDFQTMLQFCRSFSNTRWEENSDSYSQFFYRLPYYLVRSAFIHEYKNMTQNLNSPELRAITQDFYYASKELYKSNLMTPLQKAEAIEEMIKKFFLE